MDILRILLTTASGAASSAVPKTVTCCTTIHIDNGTIQGNVYGGGLGDNTVAAKVNGVVHVNVGREVSPNSFTGKASFVNGSVYGCNNVNGSPQDEVHVDIYQTAHTTTDAASYTISLT